MATITVDLEGSCHLGPDVDAEPYNPFSDKLIRNGFIRKVYALLSLMLAVTFGITGICRFVEPVDIYIRTHPMIVFIALIFYLATVISLACCPTTGRIYPWNYILLAIFTISTSALVATVCIRYSVDAILIAVGITLVIVLSVSLFSCSTSYDFTKWSWIMVMVLFSFILLCSLGLFLTLFTGQYRIYEIVTGGVGVIIFTIYLAINTQKIVGGRKYELSPEDYVYGALTLYLDTINIFLYVLRMGGSGRG